MRRPSAVWICLAMSALCTNALAQEFAAWEGKPVIQAAVIALS